MDRPLVALVLAGGTGTRLYPATRSDRPKQFLELVGDQSLLAETIDRVAFADETYVLTREDFADEVRQHAPETAVLTEPEPKDTGPALVYAAHRIREQVGDCTLVCLPSDHRIEGEFAGVAQRAATVARDTARLVTIGVEPTRPATGYGYVEPGEQLDGWSTVASFHEKPDRETASRYVERGYYWNAGIFAWTPTALLDAARATPLGPLVTALDDGDPGRGFDTIDPISIDYAVLERTENLAVVPATFAWDDLGSWDAVARHLPRDEAENAVLGDALTIDASENVIGTDGHVSVVGVDGLVVASFGDRTIVLPTEDAQRVREVVTALREDERF